MKESSADERGKMIVEDKEMEEVHKIFAQAGDSKIDNATRFHFVTYANVEGSLWELDGRREPVYKGECD